MPELPEVETIMLGITPFLEGATITKVKLNRSDLRWPFPENFAKRLEKAKVLNLKRRSKYIFSQFEHRRDAFNSLGNVRKDFGF